jgi:hypothetical protein
VDFKKVPLPLEEQDVFCEQKIDTGERRDSQSPFQHLPFSLWEKGQGDEGKVTSVNDFVA